MTDINFSRPAGTPDSAGAEGTSAAPRLSELRWDIIELLFFAYRDFVGDADHELEAFGFGRAHHRVMHFVYRYPGLKVADLLDVLRITKQSLGRVLKQLLDEGYIIQKTGNNDRRQRPTKDEPRRSDEDAARRSSAPAEDEPVPQSGAPAPRAAVGEHRRRDRQQHQGRRHV